MFKGSSLVFLDQKSKYSQQYVTRTSQRRLARSSASDLQRLHPCIHRPRQMKEFLDSYLDILQGYLSFWIISQSFSRQNYYCDGAIQVRSKRIRNHSLRMMNLHWIFIELSHRPLIHVLSSNQLQFPSNVLHLKTVYCQQLCGSSSWTHRGTGGESQRRTEHLATSSQGPMRTPYIHSRNHAWMTDLKIQLQ